MPFDAVRDRALAEIDEEAESFICPPQIGEHLFVSASTAVSLGQ